MINFVLIALCIAAGMLFRRSGTLGPDAHKSLNSWLIYLALPAVSFKYLPHIQWSKDLLIPALAPVAVWLGGWLFIHICARKKKWDKSSEGGLKLPAGLSNTSFVGFPLIMAYFSERELGIAVICDQVTFMLLATAGIVVAVNSAKTEKLTFGLVLKRIIRFPPFIATVLALTIPHFISLAPIELLFDKIAATIAPLALFSIGLQLHFEGWRKDAEKIGYALLYKLMIAPALVMVLLLLAGQKNMAAQISVFEAAMPSLLTSGVVAEQYRLNARLSNLVIGIGIILSFFTTAIWYQIIQYLM